MQNNVIDDFYENVYEEIYQSGFTRIAWRWIFKFMCGLAFSNIKSTGSEVILELGAGKGQFADNFTYPFRTYIETDIRKREKTNTLLKKKDLKEPGRIFRICDAQDLNVIPENSFDFIFATCLIMHLRNFDSALCEWNRILKPGGKLIFYVPCEPGILLRSSRFFTTRRKLNNRGYSHSSIHWSEHRNHYIGIRSYLRENFGNTLTEKKWPFRFFGWNLNLFSIFMVTKSI